MTSTLTVRRSHLDEPHFFAADDGIALTLIRVRGATEPVKGPVLLMHGAAMRAESFRPPIGRTVVDMLIDGGWDVWMLNWRGSLDLDPRPWTLDDVAEYDVPAAVRHIVAQTGAERVKAIGHCQGAAALSMAAVAGWVPEIDTVVLNSLALHPHVPLFARVKLHVLRPLMMSGSSYVDIRWGDGPETGIAWITRTAVRLAHPECHSPVCSMASFAIGSGHPALWRHENLDNATHRWIRSEFGKIPMSLYAQMAASNRAGQMVAVSGRSELPKGYAAQPPKTDARFALFTGEHNRAFVPSGMRATHAFLERAQPGRHTLQVIPGYGHADIFLGRRAHVDVLPRVLHELDRG